MGYALIKRKIYDWIDRLKLRLGFWPLTSQMMIMEMYQNSLNAAETRNAIIIQFRQEQKFHLNVMAGLLTHAGGAVTIPKDIVDFVVEGRWIIDVKNNDEDGSVTVKLEQSENEREPTDEELAAIEAEEG